MRYSKFATLSNVSKWLVHTVWLCGNSCNQAIQYSVNLMFFNRKYLVQHSLTSLQVRMNCVVLQNVHTPYRRYYLVWIPSPAPLAFKFWLLRPSTLLKFPMDSFWNCALFFLCIMLMKWSKKNAAMWAFFACSTWNTKSWLSYRWSHWRKRTWWCLRSQWCSDDNLWVAMLSHWQHSNKFSSQKTIQLCLCKRNHLL